VRFPVPQFATERSGGKATAAKFIAKEWLSAGSGPNTVLLLARFGWYFCALATDSVERDKR